MIDPEAMPKALPAPAQRALAAAGYTRLEQLTNVTEADLAHMHGMGPKAVKLLRETLALTGRSLKPSRRPTRR